MFVVPPLPPPSSLPYYTIGSQCHRTAHYSQWRDRNEWYLYQVALACSRTRRPKSFMNRPLITHLCDALWPRSVPLPLHRQTHIMFWHCRHRHRCSPTDYVYFHVTIKTDLIIVDWCVHLMFDSEMFSIFWKLMLRCSVWPPLRLDWILH